MTRTWLTDEYQEPPADAIAPPQPAVIVPGEVIASTLQTLTLLDEFFRLHASGGTRVELHQFARLHGWDPVQGANHLLDSIGLDAARLTHAARASDSTSTDTRSHDTPHLITHRDTARLTPPPVKAGSTRHGGPK